MHHRTHRHVVVQVVELSQHLLTEHVRAAGEHAELGLLIAPLGEIRKDRTQRVEHRHRVACCILGTEHRQVDRRYSAVTTRGAEQLAILGESLAANRQLTQQGDFVRDIASQGADGDETLEAVGVRAGRRRFSRIRRRGRICHTQTGWPQRHVDGVVDIGGSEGNANHTGGLQYRRHGEGSHLTERNAAEVGSQFWLVIDLNGDDQTRDAVDRIKGDRVTYVGQHDRQVVGRTVTGL